MTRIPRPRRFAPLVLAVALPVILAACSAYPNSTFSSHTDVNKDATGLWSLMMWLAALVFVLVETLLIYVMFRFRRRPGGPEPRPVHGNTAMELTWTLLPLVILAIISVPSVRSVWKFQRPAPADAIQVDVTGHQWWWEFRYPQYNITTANELYMPAGRAISFNIKTKDVIHSFWVPNLAGKRDAVSNRVNQLWFTLDSSATGAYNGACTEYCGASHANMRFRAYVVSQTDFDSWAMGQQQNAVFPPPAPATEASATTVAVSPAPAPQVGYTWPVDQLPPHVVPRTPVPAGLTISDDVLAAGNPQAGFELYSKSLCIGCHKIRGNPMSIGIIGPDLTHIGSRHTIAAGVFPNDARHLALWIKNARKMKPMVSTSMPTVGMGEIDPLTGKPVTAALGGMTDQQIADVVAYLLSLK